VRRYLYAGLAISGGITEVRGTSAFMIVYTVIAPGTIRTESD
jgi:hypothetical protein